MPYPQDILDRLTALLVEDLMKTADKEIPQDSKDNGVENDLAIRQRKADKMVEDVLKETGIDLRRKLR